MCLDSYISRNGEVFLLGEHINILIQKYFDIYVSLYIGELEDLKSMYFCSKHLCTLTQGKNLTEQLSLVIE